MPVESYNFSYAQKQRNKKNILTVVVALLCTIIVLQVVFFFIIKPQWVSSTSMQPEFTRNNGIFVAPLINESLLFSQKPPLSRGSLVTLNNGTIEDKSAIKLVIDFIVSSLSFQKIHLFEGTRWGDSEVYRIVGVPGDTLYIENYVTHIRPGGASHFLTEFELSSVEYDVISEGYPEDWNKLIGAQGSTREFSLGQNEYFLLCDNRIISSDSRIFGPINESSISGKVIAQYFPFNAIRTFQ